MSTKLQRWGVLFFCLSGILAIGSLFFRFRVESQNKAVGLCYEMQVLKEFSIASQQPLSNMFEKARAYGLTGVTLSEETLEDLIHSGEVQFVSPINLSGTRSAIERVSFGLNTRFGLNLKPVRLSESFLTFNLSLPRMDWKILKGVSCGLNPIESKQITSAGLALIARHANPLGCTPRYIHQMLKRSKELGASFYLPEGDQVLGQRTLLTETAETLKRLKLDYVSPEFARLAGDAQLSKKVPAQIVRIHSAQTAEIERMAPSAVQERYLRAFRERNIRLLLLRPMSFATENPVESLYKSLGYMKSQIVRFGGEVARPHPFANPGVPRIIFGTLGLAAASFIAVLLTSFLRRPVWVILAWVLLLVIGTTCFIPQPRVFMAFLAAVAFPVAGYRWLSSRSQISVLGSYFLLSAISITGGLVAAGFLNQLTYLVDVQRFPLVKASLALPLIFIAGVLFVRRFNLREFFKTPILWGSALLGAILLLLVLFMLVRSGNDSPAAVSSFELRIRALLDTVLYVRPRTKEFLFGHPALWVGLSLWTMSKVKMHASRAKVLDLWGAAFLALGAIGQTSLVNTFCHLHTPLGLSIIRAGEGLILGGVIGMLLSLLIPKVFGLSRR